MPQSPIHGGATNTQAYRLQPLRSQGAVPLHASVYSRLQVVASLSTPALQTPALLLCRLRTNPAPEPLRPYRRKTRGCFLVAYPALVPSRLFPVQRRECLCPWHQWHHHPESATQRVALNRCWMPLPALWLPKRSKHLGEPSRPQISFREKKQP